MQGGLFLNCITAGNVLVQLFLQTKPKYCLTNRKLQYLLIIAQMTRLNNGEEFFEDDIRNFKHTFTIDTIADAFMSSSNLVEGKTVNKPLDLSCDNFNIPYKCSRIYEITEELNEKDKKLLINIFVKFGAYDEEALCGLLNSFSPLKDLPLYSAIPKSSITEFFSNDNNTKAFENNSIFQFCEEEFSPLEPDENEAQQKGPVPNIKTIFKSGVLKQYSSLKNIVVGKNYSVLIETDSSRIINEVCIVSRNTQEKVPGTLHKINDTLYSFNFIGIPSDINISIKYA